MPKAIIMVGLPATGKTTMRESLDLTGYHIASSGDIIENIARENGKTYDEVFKDNIKTANREFNIGLNLAYKENKDVFIDRTNLNKKSRAATIDAIPSHYRVEVIQIAKPNTQEQIAEWVRRLRNRPGKTIPANVIQSMFENYEDVSYDEGVDIIKKVDMYAKEVLDN